MPVPRPRILFVSEAITLAQIVRLTTLARALDPARFEVHFASAAFPGFVFSGASFQRWPLHSLPADVALARVAAGRRLYPPAVLRRYIEADREVLRAVRPALVVGDLRWSLAVSAPLEGVPHAALINAYWSPRARRDGFPVPDHPAVRLLGEAMTARYFPVALPRVFDWFAAPLNAERKRHGLAPVGSLLQVLGHGDHTLYADPPGLIALDPPGSGAPPEPPHTFLGPVLWSAPGALPDDWGASRRQAPVYLTLGSSGATRRLPAVLEALARLPVDVLLSTAGRPAPPVLPHNVRALPYVDGAAACARARLVIHNGGSSTGYQAIAAGTPVLGLPSNFDQFLASACLDAHGAGLSLRASTVEPAPLAAAIRRALDDPGFAAAATRLQGLFGRYSATERFADFVARATGAASAAA